MSETGEAKRETRPLKSRYVLGIDIGTTTLKCCLIDVTTKKITLNLQREHKASISSDQGHLGSEQDVHKICLALQLCVSGIDRDVQSRICRIGVSGQMHGVVVWKSGEAWHQNSFSRFEIGERSRTLYTWQDGRCTPEFLSTLPQPKSHLRLSTGHGCATLFWLKQHRPNYLTYYDCAGTIQDFVVAMLCGLDQAVISAQNAASWGYFDTVSNTWNTELLEKYDFPVHLLPKLVEEGCAAGALKASWYAIAEGTEVEVALGDMQCSVFGTLQSDNDAVLNISTSAQISFIMPEGFTPSIDSLTSTVEYFPYFHGRYLAVAASLNGGNAMATFVRMLQQWTHELGLGVPENKIWDKLLAGAEEESADSDLFVVPTLFGERHLADQRASVHNIDVNNVSLGKVARALFKGIINNLVEMMPQEKLLEAGITRIVGTGSALTRNSTLKKELEIQYKLPVDFPGGACDAAYGVALIALKKVVLTPPKH